MGCIRDTTQAMLRKPKKTARSIISLTPPARLGKNAGAKAETSIGEMLKLSVKMSAAMRGCGVDVRPPGWFLDRLTTPMHRGTFFVPAFLALML